MNISRSWAMPNSNTFSIPPIRDMIEKSISGLSSVCDPFVRNSPFRCRCVSNDLDTSVDADFHLDALDFLRSRSESEFDAVLFDPPYSPRQVSECYKKMGLSVNMQTTQASFWSNLKKEIQRIVKPIGIVITCGWNSGGVGNKYGFELEKILMVAHGGWHNDTIVTVERKSAIRGAGGCTASQQPQAVICSSDTCDYCEGKVHGCEKKVSCQCDKFIGRKLTAC